MTNFEFYGRGFMNMKEFLRLIDIYKEELGLNNQESELIDASEVKEHTSNIDETNAFLADFTNWLNSECTKQKRVNDQLTDRFMEYYSTNVKRYFTWLKRGVLHNEMYVIGQIHGLQIGICDISSKTLGYDCELFEDRVMFITETTMEKFELFKRTITNIYGTDVFTFDEIELK